jgi:hypothetical protein
MIDFDSGEGVISQASKISNLSRRNFLKGVFIAAASTALPACTPTSQQEIPKEKDPTNYESEEHNVKNQIEYWLKHPEEYENTRNRVGNIHGLAERAVRLILNVPGLLELKQGSGHIIFENDQYMLIGTAAHLFGGGQTDNATLAETDIGVTQPHLGKEQNPLKLELRQAKHKINGEEIRAPGSMYSVIFDHQHDVAYILRRKDGIGESSDRGSFMIKPINTPTIGTEIFSLSFPGIMGDKLPVYPMIGTISEPTEAEKVFMKDYPGAFFVDADATGGCSGSVVADKEGNILGILVSASLKGTPHAVVVPINYKQIFELTDSQDIAVDALTSSN